MSTEILEKLSPILKSDWRSGLSEVSNIFNLIESKKLAEFDSKQIKQLLIDSEVPRLFADAILNMHYCKRKLFYKRNKRVQESNEEEELSATISILGSLRGCYQTEIGDLMSEINFYKSAMGSQ